MCEHNDAGACECSGGFLPDCGGVYCIPEVEAPPAVCDDIADLGACVTAGCDTAIIRPIVSDGGGSFVCEAQQTICTWFPEGEAGVEVETAYISGNGAGIAMFGTGYTTPPLGWRPCEADSPQGQCTWFAANGCASL